MKTSIVYGSMFEEGHKPWRPHPESPSRLRKLLSAILRHGLKNRVEWLKPIKACKEDLLKVHVKGYVDYIEELSSKAPAEVDPDTYVSKNTFETALYAYGSSMKYALEAYEKGEAYIVLTRPPGHHVGREGKAMGAPTQGFCIFNNIAGAAKYLLEQGVSSIVILDFDAHHGNGTQEIFYREDRVLHIDIHQEPSTLYPFTGYPEQVGEGRGEGYSINFILPPMAGDDCLEDILNKVYGLIKIFDPEIVLVSAGFDGYKDDGLTELRYSSKSFYNLGRMLNNLGKPLLVTLEGGYVVGLERGFPSFLAGLLSEKDPVRDRFTKTLPLIKSRALEYLSQTLSIISRYWRIK